MTPAEQALDHMDQLLEEWREFPYAEIVRAHGQQAVQDAEDVRFTQRTGRFIKRPIVDNVNTKVTKFPRTQVFH